MGNSLPLRCVCYGAGAEPATTAAAKRRRTKKGKSTACRNGRVLRHVVPVDMPEDCDAEGEEIKAAWPGCRVQPVGDDGGVRVKIVMKKREVEELVARLEQRDAAERKARMEELSTELGGCRVAAVTMSPCRDAWLPRLASIPED